MDSGAFVCVFLQYSGSVHLLLRPSLLPLFFPLPGEVSNPVPRHPPWGFAHSRRGPRLRGSTVSSGLVWAARPQAPHRFRGLAGGPAGARLRSGRQGCARPPPRPRGSPSPLASRGPARCEAKGEARYSFSVEVLLDNALFANGDVFLPTPVDACPHVATGQGRGSLGCCLWTVPVSAFVGQTLSPSASRRLSGIWGMRG